MAFSVDGNVDEKSVSPLFDVGDFLICTTGLSVAESSKYMVCGADSPTNNSNSTNLLAQTFAYLAVLRRMTAFLGEKASHIVPHLLHHPHYLQWLQILLRLLVASLHRLWPGLSQMPSPKQIGDRLYLLLHHCHLLMQGRHLCRWRQRGRFLLASCRRSGSLWCAPGNTIPVSGGRLRLSSLLRWHSRTLSNAHRTVLGTTDT